MASGSIIIDSCPVCGELVWEDEWRIFDNIIMHPRCVKGYVKGKYGMNESQFLRLCGAQELRQEILDARVALKDSMDFFNRKIRDLEERLIKIEGKRR